MTDSDQAYQQLLDHFGPEELHPDLVEHIYVNDLGWEVLKHPLVFQVPYAPHNNKQANLMYAHKLEEIVRAKAEHDWSLVMWLHERPYRPDAVVEIMNDVDDDEYWSLIRDLWIDSENIWQWHDKVQTLLLADRPGRAEGLMTDHELANLEQMHDTVTVWRGWNRPRGTRKGWSWTMNQRRGEWFSQRLAQVGSTMMLTEGEVNKTDIIAVFHGRNEAEVVVDPQHVRIIRQTSITKKDE